jgi:multidrug efflux pump subunit AcrB
VLQQATDAVVATANAEPGLAGVFTTYRSQVPQLYLNIDREKAQTLDVPLNSIFTTLQSYLGTNYVNDFNFLGRTFQVNLQGDPDFRAEPSRGQSVLRPYSAEIDEKYSNDNELSHVFLCD